MSERGAESVSRPNADCGVAQRSVIPNVAKAGGLKSQGAKGKAVVGYCDPLATPDLKSSGFPEG